MKPKPPHLPDKQTRTQTVMAAIQTKVANRTLVEGDRLPSIRRFAKTLGVSPSTVADAYDRLVAEGLIRARPGSGFYIARTPPTFLALESQVPQMRAIDPLWVSRQSLDADPQALKPGCGWLPPDWMPVDALRRATRTLARSEHTLFTNYATAQGATTLRQLLVGRFAEEGLATSLEQVLLTTSGTQAIDLVCRFLLSPGDTVLLDDPCYFNFRALLRAYPVNIISVPYTANGPDLAQFEKLLSTTRPRLYLTNSALHNPTGATLSPQTAHHLLNIAAAHELLIVEDDIFSDFEPEPSVRLATLDGLNRVIRIGSFSKTLSASIRCGYIAAKPEWITHLTDLQVATGFGGAGSIASELIANMLTSGKYHKHTEGLRQRLARTRREVADKLRYIGIEPWLMPRGGFYLWCQLPEGCDSSNLAKVALTQNMVLAPGNVFSASQSAARFMRFNVAHCNHPQAMQQLEQWITQVTPSHTHTSTE